MKRRQNRNELTVIHFRRKYLQNVGLCLTKAQHAVVIGVHILEVSERGVLGLCQDQRSDVVELEGVEHAVPVPVHFVEEVLHNAGREAVVHERRVLDFGERESAVAVLKQSQQGYLCSGNWETRGLHIRIRDFVVFYKGIKMLNK